MNVFALEDEVAINIDKALFVYRKDLTVAVVFENNITHSMTVQSERMACVLTNLIASKMKETK